MLLWWPLVRHINDTIQLKLTLKERQCGLRKQDATALHWASTLHSSQSWSQLPKETVQTGELLWDHLTVSLHVYCMHLIRLLQLMRGNICQDNPHDIPSSGELYPAETEYSPHSLQPLRRMPKFPNKPYVEHFTCARALLFNHGKIKLVGLQHVTRASNAAALFVPLYI